MNKIKNKIVVSLAAAGLAFGLAACGDDSSSSASSSDVEVSIAGVVFEGDYMAGPEGELHWIDKEGKISEKSLSFYQDSRVVSHGGDLFVLEGLSKDNIALVDPELLATETKKAVVWQKKFANGNPVDMAFDGDKAWVALQNADSLVQISVKDGKVVKSIKTGKFASKGQISPYAVDVEWDDDNLYVLFVRYSVDENFVFTYPKGLVAIFDASTGDLKDTVQLATKNPVKMTLFKDNLYVATLGEYNADGGTDADEKRGIEKVDLKAKKSEVVISGKKLGAGVYSFTAEKGIAYAAVYKTWGNTPVVEIDLEKKSVKSVKGVADAQGSLALKHGVLYVGDHTYGKEKVYTYADGKLTALEQPEGALPPYSIALF